MKLIAKRWTRAWSDSVRCICWFFCAAVGLVPVSHASEKINSVADGELRACQIVTIDNAWAVGDHGLILFTNDAGKHWEIQHQRSEAIHYAVCFTSDQIGCVVGGTIDPYSHRSVGKVLTTSDGGKTWQSTENNLPRLVGAQLLSAEHILAWGDWSSHYQSALFESMDNGRTWAARPIPCSHIQCAATSPDGVSVVVDRSGKIHRTRTGLDFETVDMPMSPFDPIRFCKYLHGTWWIGGEAGKLYRSYDAVRWEKVALPGTVVDHVMYTLSDIAGYENRVWIVGQPGNVVWTSEDQGSNWDARAIGNRQANHSISVLNGNMLLTCGPLANILASRNGGKAWWHQHQAGTRNALLNISSNCAGVAWDLMAQVTRENKRHASALVLHDQCFEERTSHLPELASRFEIAGKSIGLAQARVLSSHPVGNLYSGIRESDLGYYADEANEKANASSAIVKASSIERRLVFEIRNARPDVVVSNCRATGNKLEAKSAQAIEKAVNLAGDKDFRVFSASSGIVEDAWQTQRVLVRGTYSGTHYSPSMVMETSKVVLGSEVSDIKPLIESRESIVTSDKQFSYRIAGAKGGALRDPPLKGIVLDQDTQFAERQKNSPRLASLMATSQWFDWTQFTSSDSGNPLTPDRAWDSQLRSAAKEVSVDSVSPVLLEIAIQCRRSGDWNRWHAALEFLLERDSQSAASEAAFWELMMHTGSIETHRVLANQLQSLELRSGDLNSSAAAMKQASPFSRVQPDSSTVQHASFSGSVRRIPIATNRELSEFARLLSKWPDSFAPRRNEPRWGWLIASRYRAMQQRSDSMKTHINLGRSYAEYWPSLSPHLPGWNSIAKAERHILNESVVAKQQSSQMTQLPATLQSENISAWSWTMERPYLDGKADESFWKSATEIELRDPWTMQKETKTSIKFARDEKFLYLYSNGPVYKETRVSKDKRRESDCLKIDSDHIRLRIDVDRDYASWFEFAWSASGETSDACNDMLYWNPMWWVATASDDTKWSAEIAIPLDELVVTNTASSHVWANDVWAFNAIRAIPDRATHSVSPSISDRASVDEWFLMDLKRR